MKITIVVLAILVIAGGILWSTQNNEVVSPTVLSSEPVNPAESTTLIDTRALNKATNNVYVGRQAPVSETLSANELTELKRQAAIKQTEIEDLVLELDRALTDPNTRAIVKAKINLLKEEYNELILPIMMQEMKKRNG